MEAAERGLRSIELAGRPEIGPAAQSGRPGTPALVTRLDAPDRDYYLVPWETAAGTVLLVQVNAIGGQLAAATLLPSPRPHLPVSPDDAIQAAQILQGSPAAGPPRLVWQPCRESTSPSRPFYLVPTARGNVFVDMDGAARIALTPLGKGG